MSPGGFLPGFATRQIETAGARIHLARGGSGPPLLLLHGHPQTHLTWHKIAPRLAERFTVVAPDLRGYGDSAKPEGGERHVNYSKRAMAADQVEVMPALRCAGDLAREGARWSWAGTRLRTYAAGGNAAGDLTRAIRVPGLSGAGPSMVYMDRGRT